MKAFSGYVLSASETTEEFNISIHQDIFWIQ
jgi:hypothetical protein